MKKDKEDKNRIGIIRLNEKQAESLTANNKGLFYYPLEDSDKNTFMLVDNRNGKLKKSIINDINNFVLK